jgi:hypothetical protein
LSAAAGAAEAGVGVRVFERDMWREKGKDLGRACLCENKSSSLLISINQSLIILYFRIHLISTRGSLEKWKDKARVSVSPPPL